MTMVSRCWLGLLLATSLASPTWAREPEAPAPAGPAPAAPQATQSTNDAAVQVALAYLTTTNAKGFAGGVAFLHPDDVNRFKNLVVPVLEAERDAGRRTLLNATFGREAQLMDARLAEPADFLTRFDKVVAARQGDAPTRFDTAAPIGAVPEGEQLHVLLRTLTGPTQIPRLLVVTLKRSGTDWKVTQTAEFEALAASLRGGPRPKAEPMAPTAPAADASPAAAPERPQGAKPIR